MIIQPHIGFWRDWNHSAWNGSQILMSDQASRYATAIVAALIGLATRYIFKIVSHYLAKWTGELEVRQASSSSREHSVLQGFSSQRLRAGSSRERQPLLDSSRRSHQANDAVPSQPSASSAQPPANEYSTFSSSDHGDPASVHTQGADDSRSIQHRQHGLAPTGQPIADALRDSDDSREFFAAAVRMKGLRRWVSFGIVFLFLALFVGLSSAGLFSSDVASGRAATSSSETCGIWEIDETSPSSRDDLHLKEARAGEYARNCYPSQGPISTFGCNAFYNQSIKYTTTHRTQCPFRNDKVCWGGRHSAITFDTGLVDPNDIFLNSPAPPHFRRITTCSPLSMSQPYVQEIRDGDEVSYLYLYGETEDQTTGAWVNRTFKTTGNPFNWDLPVYSVNTLVSEYGTRDTDAWIPIEDLERDPGTTITIIFVSSAHIFYDQRSDDPIFPAPNETQWDSSLYYKADARARALACVDTTQFCQPHGGPCWSPYSQPPSVKEGLVGANWFTILALQNSNIYESIFRRLGSALFAQRKIEGYASAPLEHNQWEVEVEQLFATSLARIQFDAWSIALAEGGKEADYIDVTPDEAMDKLCGLYKYNAIGYTNLNLPWSIVIGLFLVIITVFSLDAQTLGLPSQTEDDEGRPKSLVVGVFLGRLWEAIQFFGAVVAQLVRSMMSKTVRLIKIKRLRKGSQNLEESSTR